MLSATDIHEYVSTACLHGLHDQCRIVCKFCAALCRCECHGPLNEEKKRDG